MIELFLVFMQIGVMSIGGGYASLPYIQDMVVAQRGWITEQMYVDLLTLSQMTPGPLGINAASFVGMKVLGPLGAVIATVGYVLPSFVIVLVLAYIYFKYRDLTGVKQVMGVIRPIVIGLITAVGYQLIVLVFGAASQQWVTFLLLISALIFVRKFKMNAILVIAIMGLINLCIFLWI